MQSSHIDTPEQQSVYRYREKKNNTQQSVFRLVINKSECNHTLADRFLTLHDR